MFFIVNMRLTNPSVEVGLTSRCPTTFVTRYVTNLDYSLISLQHSLTSKNADVCDGPAFKSLPGCPRSLGVECGGQGPTPLWSLNEPESAPPRKGSGAESPPGGDRPRTQFVVLGGRTLTLCVNS